MRIIVLGGHGAAGRAVVEALAPHNVRAVSRRDGVDAFTGAGLQQSFAGADVVIDLFTRFTFSSRRARAIHQTEAENVSSAAQQAGVRHVVVLSIIGVDRNPHNYYAGKLQQEQVYEASGVPLTILRAAQFHEFAAQVLDRTSLGPVGLTFQARIQPVAVQEVGRRLAAIATGPPQGRAADLARPQPESLAEMMRRYAAADCSFPPPCRSRSSAACGPD
ncbi:NAD(P)H-binding protein [Nesterenkonia sp.]|uniref:SDR family oxidoreductase n=1 Tax=Nesterenkonia sp. TaxID=704201 RepID=UPI002606EC84|nr:NAD(P)H-binding protein [Nesterenkonia sp.]